MLSLALKDNLSKRSFGNLPCCISTDSESDFHGDISYQRQDFIPMLMRPLGSADMSYGHILPSWCSSHLAYGRAFLLVDWTGDVHTLMDQALRMKCQARKTSRHTVRWPIISLPLPNGLGEVISVDCFGPLPMTVRGNQHILLFTDCFS